jgi:hypothetical protein
VCLVLVIERSQLDGPQALAVPRVKIFMARQAEPLQILAARVRIERRVHHRRIPVLEAVSCRSDDVEEVVPLERQTAPEPRDGVGHHGEIAHGLRAVPHAALPEVHEVVRLAQDAEFIDRRRSGDNGRIDERVVIGGHVAVDARARRHARETSLPGARQHEPDFVRAVRGRFDERDERRRSVDHRQLVVHPVGADAHLVRVHAIAHPDRPGPAGRDPPSVLARLLHRKRRARLVGRR